MDIGQRSRPELDPLLRTLSTMLIFWAADTHSRALILYKVIHKGCLSFFFLKLKYDAISLWGLSISSHPPLCNSQADSSQWVSKVWSGHCGSAIFKDSKLVYCLKCFKLLSAFIVRQSQIPLGSRVALRWDFFGCDKMLGFLTVA